MKIRNFVSLYLQQVLTATPATARHSTRQVVVVLKQGDSEGDHSWSERIVFVELLTPVYELLCMTDCVTPCMSKFRNGMLKLLESCDNVCEDGACVMNSLESNGCKDPTVVARLECMKELYVNRRVYI